jgi:polar amino acid transport system permease protein
MSDFVGGASATGLVLLLLGAATTLSISAAGIIGGFFIAVPVCLARRSHRRAIAFAGWFYVSFFRGVPLLVQLMVSFYGLPALGINLPSYGAAIIALAVCTAAYQAENLRGGFLAIPSGQVQAAQAFGYRNIQTLRHILLPQALKVAMPSIVNEMIAILKASAVISVVAVPDLMRISQNIVARTQNPIPWYAAAGLLYLVMNAGVAGLGRHLERRLARGMAQVTL